MEATLDWLQIFPFGSCSRTTKPTKGYGNKRRAKNTLTAHIQATSNQPPALIRTSDNADETVVNWSSGIVDSNVNSSTDDFSDRILGKSREELRAKEHAGDLLC